MEINHLNALQLGFSTAETGIIKKEGLARYIAQQLQAQPLMKIPNFVAEGPKSLKELQELKRNADNAGNGTDTFTKKIIQNGIEWKALVIERCYNTEFPLREKINLFFQNHFVSTLQSVKVPYWIFKQYETIHTHALGNYKTLVKEMVYSNAMIKYLDNQQNRKDKINENLARELLELFTLGEGNYTEEDIKNAALSLAGLTFGDEKGQYRPFLKDNSQKTFMGKTGNFVIDDIIDILFEQKNTPYFIAEKALKWFFYDNPSKEVVRKYGEVLKNNNFELKPFFQQLLVDECEKSTGGHQIKNPLVFLIQVHKDLNLIPNYKFMAFFLKNQGMDIYDQPNVKGWKGGQNWLTSQIYADRNQLIDFIISGNKKYAQALTKRLERLDVGTISFAPILTIQNKGNAQSILAELTERMVFTTNTEMQTALNQLLKYDFDPTAENAARNILNVYQYLAKSPEFQII